MQREPTISLVSVVINTYAALSASRHICDVELRASEASKDIYVRYKTNGVPGSAITLVYGHAPVTLRRVNLANLEAAAATDATSVLVIAQTAKE